MATFNQLKAAHDEESAATRQHRKAIFDLFELVRVAFYESLEPPQTQLGMALVRFTSSQNTANAPHLWKDEKPHPFAPAPFKPMKKPDAAENFVRLVEGVRAEATIGIECLSDATKTLDVQIVVWLDGDSWRIASNGEERALSSDTEMRAEELLEFAGVVTDRLLAVIAGG